MEATALYTIKEASVSGNISELFISAALYAAIPFCLYKIIADKTSGIGISTANLIWNLASTMYGLLIGVVLFSEKISIYQKGGLVLGVISTILLST